ncbi:MAG TPA: sulfur carrier protein ThiS [Bacteroidales bacterium]|jgi:sulfur carrier protein|nr:sulfur carrier protein ThiS [Bacteroidales bacterium]HOF16196.1 sulfur carrier protein ThiS [Bacteroidales bacterium]HON19880.1 sulfur carrier protein ThiS [Bacteroidales bacterium]HOR82209.1 sulfur carrier protein ThiS [Bacteroidales bacterium]HPJ91341.1 sulfur carrier protein ThiS [Bacteroidales bacterium]
MIQIFVNDDTIEVNANTTVLDLLTILNRKDDKFIAVAINNTIVSKTLWQSTFLENNDKVSIIQAVYGG